MIVYVVFSMQGGAKQLEGIFAKKDDAKGLARYLEKVFSVKSFYEKQEVE